MDGKAWKGEIRGKSVEGTNGEGTKGNRGHKGKQGTGTGDRGDRNRVCTRIRMKNEK